MMSADHIDIHRLKLPKERPAITHRFEVSGIKVYVIVGLYSNGAPAEVFLHSSKEGSSVAGFLDMAAQMMSLCLQYGVPISVVSRKLRELHYDPQGFTERFGMVHSLSDYLGLWFAEKFGGKLRPDLEKQSAEESAKAASAGEKAIEATAGQAVENVGSQL